MSEMGGSPYVAPVGLELVIFLIYLGLQMWTTKLGNYCYVTIS
jgi:hypothetical protein